MRDDLIVIEGADAAGKKTQSELALAALRKKWNVEYFDFPQYGKNLAGTLIREALDGKRGDFLGLDPRLASVPYTLDRLTACTKLARALCVGKVLCNRYTTSNIIFQGAKLKTEAEQDEYIEWLEHLEYKEHGIPEPKTVVYLHVPLEFSRRLLVDRGEAKDQHEQNEDYQQAVIDLARRLCGKRSNWVSIPCVCDGVLRSREDIHRNIMHFLDY